MKRFAALVCLVLALAACGDTAVAPTSSSGPGALSTPEEDANAPLPATTASLPPAINTSPNCGDPTTHVYNPDRLRLLAACVTVTGTVRIIRAEKDGDVHILLQLDPGQEKYINAKNVSAEQGYLVLEPVCVRTPTQADAVGACSGYANPLPIPAVGMHVAVTGAWVLDVDHGWQEIHPVTAFNGVGATPTTAPAPSSIPTPSVAPSAPAQPTATAVNTCGAPYNPWGYNFCGGNLITSPAVGFCSYFACISSFATGTGYVVQCTDSTFSKSGGHTGVCSQHGGFSRNVYSL